MKKVTDVLLVASMGLALAWTACGTGSIEVSEFSQLTQAMTCTGVDRLYQVKCEYYLTDVSISSHASITATVSSSTSSMQFVTCEAARKDACECGWDKYRRSGRCDVGSYQHPDSEMCDGSMMDFRVDAIKDIKWSVVCEPDDSPVECCETHKGYGDRKCWSTCSAEDPADREHWVTAVFCCEDMSEDSADGGVSDGGSGGD